MRKIPTLVALMLFHILFFLCLISALTSLENSGTVLPSFPHLMPASDPDDANWIAQSHSHFAPYLALRRLATQRESPRFIDLLNNGVAYGNRWGKR